MPITAPAPATAEGARPEEEDRGLVERARSGDTGAFEALVRRYEGWVFTLALRMVGNRAEAEDVSQEVFLKAYRGLPGFKGASRFSTWLYRIACHHCLNHLQARKHRPGLPGSGAEASSRSGENPASPGVDQLPDGRPRADALLERADRMRIVQNELSHLTEEHRLILVLREVQGLSYEEIARTLGLELGTVRSRLHRARLEMKARLMPYL